LGAASEDNGDQAQNKFNSFHFDVTQGCALHAGHQSSAPIHEQTCRRQKTIARLSDELGFYFHAANPNLQIRHFNYCKSN